MLKLIILLLFTGIISCTTKQSNLTNTSISIQSTDTLPIRPILVDTSEDEGWGGDVKLSFTSKYYTDTSIVYEVKSTFENKELGFKASLPKKGHGTLIFFSTGANSDRFIRFLKYLYLSRTDTLIRFNKQTSVDFIAMGSDVDSFHQKSKGIYSITNYCKLFFIGKKEEDYAELYFNINDEDHWIELKEKDIDYRNMIIKLLSTK